LEIGAELVQGFGIGESKSISYASKKFNLAQGRYSLVERKYLAIVWVVDWFRSYLESGKFILCTDNMALHE